MKSRAITCVVILVFILCDSDRLFASDSAASAKAFACFQEGKTLFRGEEYAQAADRFREAYDLKPSWKLLFNIGQSEAAAKRHGLALEAFEMFLSEGGDDIDEAKRDMVLEEVDRLRKIVGFLKVEAARGTVIFVDNVLRGTAPILMALPVSVGTKHIIRGERQGEIVDSRQFRVTGGQTVTVVLDVQMVETSTTESEEQNMKPSSSSSDKPVDPVHSPSKGTPMQKNKAMVLAGFSASGVGAGLLVGGVIAGGVALSKNQDLVAACKETPCPELRGEKSTQDNLATVSTVLIPVGGAVLVTGVVLLVLGKRKEKKDAEGVSLVPGFGSVRWRF